MFWKPGFWPVMSDCVLPSSWFNIRISALSPLFLHGSGGPCEISAHASLANRILYMLEHKYILIL